MPHRDDVVLANEDCRFSVSNLVGFTMSCPSQDEELVPVHVHLWQLMGTQSILDGEGMQAKRLLEFVEL